MRISFIFHGVMEKSVDEQDEGNRGRMKLEKGGLWWRQGTIHVAQSSWMNVKNKNGVH